MRRTALRFVRPTALLPALGPSDGLLLPRATHMRRNALRLVHPTALQRPLLNGYSVRKWL